MFEKLKKIFSGDTDIEMSDQDPLTVHLALTVLLFDAAFADGRCSNSEKKHLIGTLETKYGVSPDEIETLIADRNKERKAHVGLFRYTRFLNENFTESKKIEFMEAVWQIILTDGHLEDHEDHFAHRLADLLNLSHRDLIDAKLRARKHLAAPN
ncbi:tellurite resistance TerB family protein [Desulfocicer niacini]